MNSSARNAIFLTSIFLIFATVLPAAQSVPAGTVLAVRLNSTLSSANSRAGQIVTARVMQDTPLPGGSKIHAGAKVIGHVVNVTPATNAGASIAVRFDTLQTAQGKVPITTNLRAIASFVAVEQAQIPIDGPDRGTSEYAWITEQIGGDTVYRGGGPVDNFNGKVGIPVAGGVLSHLTANPDRGCRGAINANDSPQAVWVFSSDACGTYGLSNVVVRHTGRTDPAGEIDFTSSSGQVKIHSGAGILLRIGGIEQSGA
jgi:hypothetical protein